MGGRGSCYLNYNNPNNNDNQILSDLLDNADNDKDTLKEYNGKTQKLKDKNIHIKESTDHLPEDVFIPNVRKIDSLTRKYIDTSDILENKQEQLSIRSDKLKSNTVACFVSNSNFSGLQIVLNKDLTFANRERVEKMAKDQIDIGYWSQSDKHELVNHTLTHEFGHYVQKVIMEKEKETPKGKERYNKMSEALSNTNNINEKNLILKTYSEDCATRYFKEIQRIHRKMFGTKEDEKDISEYAKKSNRETFAELFANLNTSKNPSKLSQAMLIFLEKNMTVKGKKID